MNTTPHDYLNDTLRDRAVIFPPGAGEVIHLSSGVLTFKVTSQLSNDQLGVYEIILQAKSTGAKMHFHRFMDETFLINKGILTVMLPVPRWKKEALFIFRDLHRMASGTIRTIRRPLPYFFNPGRTGRAFSKGFARSCSNSLLTRKNFYGFTISTTAFPWMKRTCCR